MSTEALLVIANLSLWVISLVWITRLLRSSPRHEAADLGAAGHYRLGSYLFGIILAVIAYFFASGKAAHPATNVLLSVALAGQLTGLIGVDRWHRMEEKNARGRVEMYSDLTGCLMLLGVAGLVALGLVPALIAVVLLFLP
jgi:hypothetical protein